MVEKAAAPVVAKFDPKKEADVIMEKALKGKGFVLFAAVLTDKKDKDDNFLLEFHYVRHKYGFEDLPKAIVAFRTHCQNEVLNIMGGQNSKT